MDWTVAMVVDVVYTTEADGRVVNIAFDLKRKYDGLIVHNHIY